MPTSTIPELLIVLLALLIVAAPAALLLRVYQPNLPPTDYGVLGLLVGLAMHVVVLTSVPFVLPWLEVAIAAALLGGAATLWRFRRPPPRQPLPPDERRLDWLLLAILAGQFALLLVPSVQNPLPFGTDAEYHVAISDKLLRAGGLPRDFLPYDPVAPTYTLGSHLLIAFASLQTALPVHRLYQFVLPLCLVLTSGLLYQVGRLAFGARAGVFAAFAYAFLTNWGSLDLLRWGSVPNAMGMAFFVAAARFVIAPVTPAPIVLPAIFVGAMASTHHLSALIFGLVCAVWAGVHLRRSGLAAPLVRQVTGAWALGLVLVLPGVWALAAEVVRSLLSGEQAALDAGLPYLNVVEPLIPIWAVPGKLGFVMFVLALGHLGSGRRDPTANPVRRDVLIWTTTMAAAFAVLDWPVRWAIEAIWRRELAILTPSRFLTDLAYPLCLVAGAGFASLWHTARKTTVVLLVAGPVYAWAVLAPLTEKQIAQEAFQGFAWLSANTPADSLILQAPRWTTYVSGREADWMVLREERLSAYTDQKRRLAEQGTGGIERWIDTYNRPVYIWDTRDLSAANLARVWQGGQASIYRFVPR